MSISSKAKTPLDVGESDEPVKPSNIERLTDILTKMEDETPSKLLRLLRHVKGGKIKNPLTGKKVDVSKPIGRRIAAAAEQLRARVIATDKPTESVWQFNNSLESYSWDPRVLTATNSVSGKTWVLSHNKLFPSWITEEYKQYVLSKPAPRDQPSDTASDTAEIDQPFRHQLFIKDYMGYDTPYRGCLLYHGLGSGKTRTAIMWAQNLLNSGEVKRIIILTPASLQDNFRSEITKWIGKDDSVVSKFSYVNTNGNPITDLARLGVYIDEAGKMFPPRNVGIVMEEVHNVVNMMTNPDGAYGPTIYKLMVNAVNCKFLALSGTPMIDKPFELSLLFNILRGIMKVDGDKRVLFPENPDDFYKLFVDKVTNKVKNPILFKRRIAGLVSYYKGASETVPREVYPELFDNDNKPILVNMSDRQFKEYWMERRTEIKKDKGSQRKRGVKAGSSKTKDPVNSTFRQRTRMICNFVFPPNIPRPMSKKVTAFKEIDNIGDLMGKCLIETRIRTSQLNALKDLFRPFNGARVIFNQYVSDINKSIGDDTGKLNLLAKAIYMHDLVATIRLEKEAKDAATASGETFVKVSEGDKSPKSISRPTLFRSSKLLTDRQYDILMAFRPGVFTYKESVDKVLKMFEYMPSIFKGDELASNSPKMKLMLDIVQESPGSVFVYSCYRELEGVGIFSKALMAHGYDEIDPDDLDGEGLTFDLDDDKKSIDAAIAKIKPGLRFAFFRGASSGKDSINRLKIKAIFNHVKNKNGELVKVILGTAAAAEGISFRNVRRIIITESHWHAVRRAQVVGRGRRVHSHSDLPVEDRTLAVYQVLATLTDEQKEQIKKSKPSLFKAESVTTDEFIYDMAVRKYHLTQQFMKLLMEAAVDGKLFSEHNGKEEVEYLADTLLPNLKYGDNDKLLYHGDINNERDDIMVIGKSALANLSAKAERARGFEVFVFKSKSGLTEKLYIRKASDGSKYSITTNFMINGKTAINQKLIPLYRSPRTDADIVAYIIYMRGSDTQYISIKPSDIINSSSVHLQTKDISNFNNPTLPTVSEAPEMVGEKGEEADGGVEEEKEPAPAPAPTPPTKDDLIVPPVSPSSGLPVSRKSKANGKVKTINGDLTKVFGEPHNIKYIVHQTNMKTKDGKGEGLAHSVFSEWPQANSYNGTAKRGKIGHNIIIQVSARPDKYVVNLNGQIYPGKPKFPGDSTEDRVKYFTKAIKRLMSKLSPGDSVAFPNRIGCGLAGGKWSTYRKIIKDTAAEYPGVAVYIVKMP